GRLGAHIGDEAFRLVIESRADIDAVVETKTGAADTNAHVGRTIGVGFVVDKSDSERCYSERVSGSIHERSIKCKYMSGPIISYDCPRLRSVQEEIISRYRNRG